MDDPTNYHLLKTLESNPELTQRDLAKELGFSLGKTNYCLRALMDKGLVKASNFRNSRNKTAYIYTLTPQGIEEKARVTYRFLKRKQREYEELKREIEELAQECEGMKVRK
jgi:EPS-associated MarR family transcriptional regulator